ncbi:MAG TPA: DUF2752 domain-containing protein [Nocardioides sp.]|uniref:DUF2752 domain-containing protein n=1 Tax=Nocardioides sp. TaxID=35761 RepID=UPI002C7715D1|nr:DUF2752 domain-containing protein [Nocardioides sp.]HQR25934.1 DUF2752 domain-containing protein [Nocardioides sp.]
MSLLAARPVQGAAGTRWQRLRPPLATLGGLALGAVALHVRDPHVQGSWGVCPTFALFGVYCPGCGGLRAVNDLTHADLAGAASSNLLLVVLLPVVGWVAARTLLAAWHGRAYTPKALGAASSYAVLTAVMVVFTVLRNLPAGGWLAP